MTDWFAKRVIKWAERHGRTDLPWQSERTPYRVWVSEIMLQQTRVQTVIPYFERFMSSLPTVNSLAEASLDDVLSLWTGLGYYRRARLLHEAAIEIVHERDGRFPDTLDALTGLPGIGRSTAGAILSSGFNKPGVILDGNVKRVLARFHAVEGEVRRVTVLNRLWTYAESHTPTEQNAEYAQAIMDLGATCCTKNTPNCPLCPVRTRCEALKLNGVERFPTKNRRHPIRNESLRLLLVIDGKGRSLLQRQPDDGLWGGLWLPLQVSKVVDPLASLAEVGVEEPDIDRAELISPFVHTLSHIRFKITATLVYLANSPQLSPSNDNLRWLDTNEAPTIGLSTLTLATLEKVRE